MISRLTGVWMRSIYNNCLCDEGTTELYAATAYACAWNRLDCTEFLELLAPDAHYASQWVFEELESKAAIADYLIAKMRSVRDSNALVFAELGKTSLSWPGRDYVALAQGRKDVVSAVVMFTIEEGHVKRFDLCMPDLVRVIRSGHYPG